MSRRGVCAALVLGLWGLAGALSGAEIQGYELSVVMDGSPVFEHAARGRLYVEALRGRSFSLRIHNPTGERIAVAVSVDGLNVIDAKRTSASGATKWIVFPYQTLEIPGWQISGEAARRFFFTETRSSYARWIGDTRNVGTIEAVFFRERWSRPDPPIALNAPDDRVVREEAEAAPRSQAAPEGKQRDAQARERGVAPGESPSRPADSYAATGAGERTSHSVRWMDFDEDPTPVARVTLRYEFRPELIRLGVLRPIDDLRGRERGHGFEGGFAPDPGDRRR